MQKQKILLMVAICAVALAGCRKKETMDLSSLHTTAAVEKETMPVTTAAETTAAAVETGASESSSAESKFSIKTTMKTYKDGGTSIEYPEVSNMKDAKLQEQVNELLQRNATAVLGAYPSQSVTVKASVESVNLKRITVTYSGEAKKSGGSGSTKLFYTNAIDLDTAQNLKLSDYTDAYTAAGYIVSGDCRLKPDSGSDEAAVRAYLNGSGKTTDYYYKLLTNADFSGGYTEEAQTAAWPEVFSYESQGVIYIIVPVSAELGDYAVIRYSPDNK